MASALARHIRPLRHLRPTVSACNARHFSTTRDEAEVNKFSGLNWLGDAAGSGPAAELFKMHETRWRMIKRFITQKYRLDYHCSLQKHPSTTPERPFNVVDVGCGGGLLTASFAALGANVTAVDLVQENLDQTKERVERLGYGSNVRLEKCTVEELVREGSVFDIVCSLEVVEHVANPAFFLSSCAKLVQSGGDGTLILSTINRTVKSYLLAIVAAERLAKKVPEGTHDWNKFVKPEEIEDVIHAEGLHTLHVNGMAYNPLTETWFECPTETDVNYMLIASS